jgi:hypothetical protein
VFSGRRGNVLETILPFGNGKPVQVALGSPAETSMATATPT